MHNKILNSAGIIGSILGSYIILQTNFLFRNDDLNGMLYYIFHFIGLSCFMIILIGLSISRVRYVKSHSKLSMASMCLASLTLVIFVWYALPKTQYEDVPLSNKEAMLAEKMVTQTPYPISIGCEDCVASSKKNVYTGFGVKIEPYCRVLGGKYLETYAGNEGQKIYCLVN